MLFREFTSGADQLIEKAKNGDIFCVVENENDSIMSTQRTVVNNILDKIDQPKVDFFVRFHLNKMSIM